MHDTGCLGLVHWEDSEGGYGEGGGRREARNENNGVFGSHKANIDQALLSKGI